MAYCKIYLPQSIVRSSVFISFKLFPPSSVSPWTIKEAKPAPVAYLPTCQPNNTALKMIFSNSSSACRANDLTSVLWSPSS